MLKLQRRSVRETLNPWFSSQIIWLPGKQHSIWEWLIQQLISASTVPLCSPLEQEKASRKDDKIPPAGFSSPAAADKVDLPRPLGEVTHQVSAGYFPVTPLLLSPFLNQHLPMNKTSLTSKTIEKASRTSPHPSVGLFWQGVWGAVMAEEIRALWCYLSNCHTLSF